MGLVFLYLPGSGAAGYSGTSNGDGTFTFTGVTVSPGFDTIRLGEFNGDRLADIVLYSSATGSAYSGLGNGSPSGGNNGTYNFSSLFWSPAYDFVVGGDLNGDGRTDFILYTSSGTNEGTMYACLANSSGQLSSCTYSYISSGYTKVLVADFNGDGKADILLYRSSDGWCWLGLSNGNGTFSYQRITSLPAGMDTAATGDLNGDGMMDVLLYNSGSGSMVSAISTGTNFTASTQTVSSGYSTVMLFDCNGDGKSDVLLYDKLQNHTTSMGMGRGDGTFNMSAISMAAGYDKCIRHGRQQRRV